MQQHGYSVMDVVVALAIIAVLAGLAWSPSDGLLTRYRLWAASGLLACDIRVARMRAISRTAQVAVVFDGGEPWRYRIFEEGVATPVKDVSLRDYCPRIEVGAPSSPLVFYPSGACRGGTVVLTRRLARRKVVCSLVGRVRCCWEPAS
jgi:Tfp pilus assembly protein FimT